MRKIYLLISVLLLFSNIVLAQDRSVTGTVRDENNEPLPGVTVVVKGSKASTSTDANGKYIIKVTNLQNVVVGVSFIGYSYQEKTLRVGEMNADFRLVPVNKGLDEVVVVGYGEQKKVTLTGAVGVIDNNKVKDIPSLNLAASLVGQLPSVSIAQDNRPGQPASITIRNPINLNGINGTTSPIYIIDDVQRTQNDFNLLDINEIESITVLKDAEATIYGVNGGNGAVLVRTKRGKLGAPKISFSSSFGTANAIQLPKMLTGLQFAQWSNDYNYIGVSAPSGVATGNTIDANGYINGVATNKLASWYTPDELAYFANPANNTNFLKQEFQAAKVLREAINVSGATDKVNYFIGADYVNQGSNFAGINSDKWGLRANLEAKPAKGLTASLNVNTEQFYTKSFWYKQAGTSESLNNDVISLLQAEPWQKYYINGNPVLVNPSASGATEIDNINVNLFQNSDNYTKQLTYSTNFLARLAYEIPGVNGLVAAVSYNDNISNSYPSQYGTAFDYYRYTGTGDNNHIPGGTLIGTTTINNGNVYTFNPSYTTNYQLDASLNYHRSFKKHNITALAIYEQREVYTDGVTTSAQGPIIGAPDNINFAPGVTSANQANSQVAESGQLSYIARINYDYDNKYLVQLVGRRDGTSLFEPGRRYGNFGSVSLGWVVSNEEFFKKKFDFINLLKFRANAGTVGSNQTAAYQYLQLYNIQVGSSGGAVFNEGLRGNGLKSAALANPGVTWDHQVKTDYGLDMEFLKGRLALSADYYWNHYYDLLTSLSGVIPATIGNTPPTENYGIVNAFGTEISLSWRDHIGKNFGYNVTAFYTWNDDKNIREDLAQGLVGTIQDRTGKSDDGGVFGYQSLGLIRTQSQADQIIAQRAAAAGGASNVKIFGQTPAPGMINYADLNGDGVISTDTKDEKYLSHKASNHNTIGFNFGGNYKSLSFNVVTGLSWGGQGVIPGTEITSSQKSDLNENRVAFWADHWTPTNTNAKYPAPYYITNYNVTSNFWFVNSFNWNIQNANISYTLPPQWTKVVGVSSARIYAQCTNVLSLYNPYPDHYRYPGNSVETYPTLRTISLGLNVGF